eukprot:CAMPEP_0197021760 /NCGR_PEP_ID=MMETSP1384-20130603/2688_1 /TAXON_ID=29189 /ORGANISM="Ammonia sp." /LENGTH=783 /DNA_ID=CAMNT_0042449665 /DNA_START=114 /DNA_END=2465 /DNA_ORIENTATION=+
MIYSLLCAAALLAAISAQCQNDTMCLASGGGTCMNPGANGTCACSVDAECADGYFCHFYGVCYPGCNVFATLYGKTPDAFCNATFGVNTTDEYVCDTDGLRCVGPNACATTANCSVGYYCNDYAWPSPECEPMPSCSSDDDCYSTYGPFGVCNVTTGACSYMEPTCSIDFDCWDFYGPYGVCNETASTCFYDPTVQMNCANFGSLCSQFSGSSPVELGCVDGNNTFDCLPVTCNSSAMVDSCTAPFSCSYYGPSFYDDSMYVEYCAVACESSANCTDAYCQLPQGFCMPFDECTNGTCSDSDFTCNNMTGLCEPIACDDAQCQTDLGNSFATCGLSGFECQDNDCLVDADCTDICSNSLVPLEPYRCGVTCTVDADCAAAYPLEPDTKCVDLAAEMSIAPYLNDAAASTMICDVFNISEPTDMPTTMPTDMPTPEPTTTTCLSDTDCTQSGEICSWFECVLPCTETGGLDCTDLYGPYGACNETSGLCYFDSNFELNCADYGDAMCASYGAGPFEAVCVDVTINGNMSIECQPATCDSSAAVDSCTAPYSCSYVGPSFIDDSVIVEYCAVACESTADCTEAYCQLPQGFCMPFEGCNNNGTCDDTYSTCNTVTGLCEPGTCDDTQCQTDLGNPLATCDASGIECVDNECLVDADCGANDNTDTCSSSYVAFMDYTCFASCTGDADCAVAYPDMADTKCIDLADIIYIAPFLNDGVTSAMLCDVFNISMPTDMPTVMPTEAPVDVTSVPSTAPTETGVGDQSGAAQGTVFVTVMMAMVAVFYFV